MSSIAGQPGGQERGLGPGAAHDRHARDVEQAARDDHGAVAVAVGEPAGRDRRDGASRSRPGTTARPARQQAVVPHAGEEQDVGEDRREERHRRAAAGRGSRGGSVRDPQQRRIDDRARVRCRQRRAVARAGQRRRGEGAEHARARPAPVPPSRMASASAPRPPMTSAAPSRSGRPVACSSRSRPTRRGRRANDQHAEREVDDEDPAPVAAGPAAPPSGGPEAAASAAEAPHSATAAARSARAGTRQDQRERDGHDHGRAGALQRAGGDQHLQPGAAAHSADASGEQRDAGQEDALAPEPVGDPARGHEQRGDDDEVGVEDPARAAVGVACSNDAAMPGNAVLTIVVSRNARKPPAQAVAIASARRLMPRGTGGRRSRRPGARRTRRGHPGRRRHPAARVASTISSGNLRVRRASWASTFSEARSAHWASSTNSATGGAAASPAQCQ